MIKLYFNGSPNPTKIAWALGEIGLAYEAIPVDDEIAARPAAQQAATLKDRHPFKAEIDDETRRDMLRYLAG